MAHGSQSWRQGGSSSAPPDGSIEARIRYSYGGSDNTAPSFNNTQYVRYGSAQAALDLGPVEQLRAEVEGLVGSESGASSLFFRFSTARPARIGARRVPLNPYTDQYVSVALSTSDGAMVAVEEHGLATSPAGQNQGNRVTLVNPMQIGYVETGYWLPGYADADDIGLAEIVDLGEAPIGAQLPAGSYFFVVSSSQWQALPYRFILSVAPSAALRGVAEFSLQSSARIGRVNFAGVATLDTEASARLRNFYELAGTAEVTTEARATLRRTSPFG